MSSIVAVLGASGNIGKLIVPYLASKGYQVRAVGRSKPKFDLQGVINHAVNYDNQEELNQVCQGTTAIYMLIGIDYKTSLWQTEWPPLTQKLIKASEVSGSKLVFFDNVYAYGLVNGVMTEQTDMNPSSKKGQVRKVMDQMVLTALSEGRIKAVLAKSPDFYGPGITTSVIGDRFFKLIIDKKTVEWFGNPDKVHNFAFVSDIPAALEKLGSSDLVGNIHLPTGPGITGHEFVKILSQLVGTKLKLSPMRQRTAWWLGIFAPILRELHEMMYQSENDYRFDSSKILKLFPELTVTDYNQGLAQTLNWYKSNTQQKICQQL